MNFRLTTDLLVALRADLRRPHPFAAERVAFVFGRQALTSSVPIVILANFLPVEDDDYEDDASVGARIGAVAINKALRRAATLQGAAFHVHAHEHGGRPWFSRTDLRELPPVMEPFRHLVPTQPRGLLVLSNDNCAGLVWPSGEPRSKRVGNVTAVGSPMQFLKGPS
jgi:hypothetical protein